MEGKTAVVLGATGLVGHQLVLGLLQDEYFAKIRILVRKPIDIHHLKLEMQVVNFEDEHDLATKIGKGDFIFCCVGTTRKKVGGDRTAYRKVDYDIPMNTARIGIQKGYSQYVLISAVGANAFAGNFYLQLKGSLEEDIMPFPYKSIHIFRPSMLVGKREDFRFGERIGIAISQAISILLIGSLRKYKPVRAGTVAQAMTASVKQVPNGVNIYEYDELMKLITSHPHQELSLHS